MVVGLTILIWSAATYGPWKPEAADWWDGNAKVSKLFCMVNSFTDACGFLDGGAVHVHSRIGSHTLGLITGCSVEE
jgi:hypothetical protein